MDAGYEVDLTEDIAKLGVRFFNVLSRTIDQSSRNVHESREFSCPIEHDAGYSALKVKIKAGNDVTPNLSTRLLDGNFQDRLLWDWGIHHFHLGQVLDPEVFVARTGPLLFAYVTDTDFYSIQVLDHSSFTNQELMRILHRNWPELIESKRLKGILGLTQTLSDEDVKTLRSAGVQTPMQVESGVVYAPLGGGYSTAGTSIKNQMQYSHWVKTVRNIEMWVKENVEELRNKLRNRGTVVPDPLSFNLIVQEDGLYVIETQSKVAFLTYAFQKKPLTKETS